MMKQLFLATTRAFPFYISIFVQEPGHITTKRAPTTFAIGELAIFLSSLIVCYTIELI